MKTIKTPNENVQHIHLELTIPVPERTKNENLQKAFQTYFEQYPEAINPIVTLLQKIENTEQKDKEAQASFELFLKTRKTTIKKGMSNVVEIIRNAREEEF